MSPSARPCAPFLLSCSRRCLLSVFSSSRHTFLLPIATPHSRAGLQQQRPERASHAHPTKFPTACLWLISMFSVVQAVDATDPQYRRPTVPADCRRTVLHCTALHCVAAGFVCPISSDPAGGMASPPGPLDPLPQQPPSVASPSASASPVDEWTGGAGHISHYKLIHTIGRGNFGVCHLAECIDEKR